MRVDFPAKALSVSRPADATQAGPRAADPEITAPLRLTRAPSSGVEASAPLVLHASAATPPQCDEPCDAGADALAAKKLKQERAKAKKARAKADKAKRPELKGERLLDAVARLKATSSGDPARLFLTSNEDGVWQLQDKPPSQAVSVEQQYQATAAFRAEVWLANLDQPFMTQLGMCQEAEMMAEALGWMRLRKDGGCTLRSVLLLAEGVAPALTCRTPEELHEQWLANAQWRALVAKEPGQADAIRCEVGTFQRSLHTCRLSFFRNCLTLGISNVFRTLPSSQTPLDVPRTRRDVERIFSQALLSDWAPASQLTSLIQCMRDDATLSGHVLDFLPVLGGCATSAEEAVLLQTMAVALTISMSSQVLGKLCVTREQLEGIQGHVFMLGGHIEAFMRDTSPAESLNPFDPVEMLRLGEIFLHDDDYREGVCRMLEVTQILQVGIEQREARIDRLVQIEAKLRSTDATVSFEGMPLDTLLDHFVPLQTRSALTTTRLPALTLVDEETTPAGNAPTPNGVPGEPAEAAAPADPQDSLEHWQQVWESFRVKNERRHRETAAAHTASRTDTQAANVEDESEAKRPAPRVPRDASNFGGKQPGSRDHTDGRHGLPGKGLPNAVRKLRLAAIHDATRNGVHFTDDDRRKAWARLEAAGFAARSRVPEVD